MAVVTALLTVPPEFSLAKPRNPEPFEESPMIRVSEIFHSVQGEGN